MIRLRVNPQIALNSHANIALVANHQAPNALGQLPERLALITRSGRHRAGGDHPVEGDHQMTVKAMVILFFCRTVAQIRDPGEPPALLGAGQAAHGQGTAIDQANGVGRRPKIDQELLIEPLLDDPEIGRLLGEGGPRPEFQKPRPPVSTKILPDADIRIHTQKLTHHLHRDHFAVGQFRGKASLA